MLTTTIKALRWTGAKLENLLADLAANYARGLLAAHGLVEIEIDHIRRNFPVEPATASIENHKMNRSIPSNGNPRPYPRPEVIRVEGAPHSTEEVQSLRAPTPKFDLWSGPEVVAALSVAAAAIVALLFCLAAIFKS